MTLRTLPGIIAALACSAHAAAGTYVEASRTDLRAPLRSPENQKLWFDGGSFRLENESADAVEIFKNRTLYLITPPRKRYAAIDESRLGGRVSGSRTMPQAAVVANASLRPANGLRAGSVPAPQRMVRPTSRTESNGDETCSVWEVSVGGSKVQELCVIPVAAVPGGADILADMRQIGALVRDRGLDGSLGSSVVQSWGDVDAVDGIPVISRTFDENGRAAVEIRITAMRSEPVPVTAFEIPAGFKRRSLAAGGI
ncbi:MAG TPA: hypothetical protein VMD03_01890 [Steroidobacteraceae bacterium]|nr:hypothetical protein [Steroidobacteraceae bacterium]